MNNQAVMKRRDGDPATFCENVGADRVKIKVDGRHVVISLAEWQRLPLFSEPVIIRRGPINDI
jgi:hypothetical protein